jgi:hypothetical protein
MPPTVTTQPQLHGVLKVGATITGKPGVYAGGTVAQTGFWTATTSAGAGSLHRGPGPSLVLPSVAGLYVRYAEKVIATDLSEVWGASSWLGPILPADPPTVTKFPSIKGSPRIGATLRGITGIYTEGGVVDSQLWEIAADNQGSSPETVASSVTVTIGSAWAGKYVRFDEHVIAPGGSMWGLSEWLGPILPYSVLWKDADPAATWLDPELLIA